MVAAVATAGPVPAPGTLVAGRYRIGKTLGEGGMGVVLAAEDERSGGADVALKLLQVVGRANTERFLREARLASRIDSAHVVSVFDMGTHDGLPFLVMDRLRGQDFGEKIRSFRLTLTEVADCVVQVCEALAHAHGAGIVHRDIKASNIFEHVGGDGVPIVKVLDFGISKTFASSLVSTEQTVTHTRDGGFLGSPPYMSPEHIKDPRHVDGRTDLWSLGVVAFRLLSTAFPFDGSSAAEILVGILGKSPPTLRDVGVTVPAEVEGIIARCLTRPREHRFQNAGELAAAFAPFASPRWASYARSVPEIVERAHVKPPAAEPATRTVPPPASGERGERDRRRDVADSGLEFAPTAAVDTLPFGGLAIPPPDIRPADDFELLETEARTRTAFYDAGSSPRPEPGPIPGVDAMTAVVTAPLDPALLAPASPPSYRGSGFTLGPAIASLERRPTRFLMLGGFALAAACASLWALHLRPPPAAPEPATSVVEPVEPVMVQVATAAPTPTAAGAPTATLIAPAVATMTAATPPPTAPPAASPHPAPPRAASPPPRAARPRHAAPPPSPPKADPPPAAAPPKPDPPSRPELQPNPYGPN
jgi:serine/threonine-protein kinase